MFSSEKKAKNNNTLYNQLNVSKFLYNQHDNTKTTFNIGELVPIHLKEVIPSEVYTQNIDSLLRVNSPFFKAPLETLEHETFTFFIPYRLLWDEWKRFMGEVNDYDAYDFELSIPQVNIPSNIQISPSSIISYLGLAPRSTTENKISSVSKLPLNAYALIVNEFFINQNLQQKKFVNTLTQDITLIDVNDPDYDFNTSNPSVYTGGLFRANKKRDYFTGAFPQPQKGDAVTLNLTGTMAPVITGEIHTINDDETPLNWSAVGSGGLPNNIQAPIGTDSTGKTDQFLFSQNDVLFNPLYPNNLYADLSGINSININDLRQAISEQRIKEVDLIGGTRYYEYLNSHFGVNNQMYELDYPILIGYSNSKFAINQIVQTSLGFENVEATTQLGNVAGYGVGAFQNGSSNHKVAEHGLIMTLALVRQNHTYQDSLDKLFLRQKKEDFYDTIYNNLGFQAISSLEHNAHNTSNYTFGFKPAWDEFRNSKRIVTGQLNSSSIDLNNNPNSIDAWHFGDASSDGIILNSDFITESKENVDRTLQIPSTLSNQIIADYEIKIKRFLPLPNEYVLKGIS